MSPSVPPKKKPQAAPSEEEPVRSRIAQAGQKILAEAARTLSGERLPRATRLPGRPARRAPLPELADGLSESERMTLVEVMDPDDRPLLCMLPETALRQTLRLRVAAVALRTRQNRIVLHKRDDPRLGSPGKWDVYTGFVLVGEAREDAAQRLLRAAGVSGASLTGTADGASCGIGPLTLYVADLPSGLYPVHAPGELLETDADELAGLARATPELLTPELVWAAGGKSLFKE